MSVRVRDKGQVTLPASIRQQANIQVDDELDVSFANGAIVLKPVLAPGAASADDVMAFAGMGRGLWGNTHEEVTATINELRDEWER